MTTPRPLRLLWRLGEAAALVAYHGARALGRAARDGAGGGEVAGRFLADLCESLGATFVKVGQILSSRPDLLPPEVVAPLRRLQDQVAPFDTRRVPALVEAAFGRPAEEVFVELDLDPISSASVAHVHRARLRDGRVVAVKIRRPGVTRRVRDDLALLSFFAGVLDRLPALRMVPVQGLVEEIGAAIEQQLDLAREAANNRRFLANFTDAEFIKLPALVDELCTESVLTMEYLEDLRKVDEPDLPAGDRERAAVSGLRALYKMIFLDGFIHADMHPGNVFLRQWGEFVMLDLGLVAELSRRDQRYFVDFFHGMVTNDGLECARVIRETAAAFAPGFDRAAFEGRMIELIARHSARRAEEFEVSAFAYQLFDVQRKSGLRGATNFTMTILSMVVFEGIVKQLHPRLDFQREARGFLIAAKYGGRGD